MSESQGLNPTVDFIAGVLSGVAGLVVGYPFDTVKVRFQHPDFDQKYSSTTNAIVTIVREEKVFGLFKGITSPLSTAALMNGLIFTSYRFLLKLQLENLHSVPTLLQVALAGAGCGIITSILTTPVELVKIRQQADVDETSASRVTMDIVKTSGIQGLFRGLTVTALRDSGYGAYFWAYEATCRYFSPAIVATVAAHINTDQAPTTPSWAVFFLAGAVAGVIGWIVTFPLDVVKTRMQGSDSPSRQFTSGSLASDSHITAPLLSAVDPYPYRTMLSTVINSYCEGGIGVFYRGLTPTLIRAVPVNAVTFPAFELVVYVLSR